MSLLFTAFYDFEFFSRKYPYHRDWLGFSYWSTYREMEFKHYILSHGSVWEVIIKVGIEEGDKDIYDMIIKEVMQKKRHYKEDVESTTKKAFIIAETPERGLSVDDFFDLIVNYSCDYIVDSPKAQRLLNGPRVTANKFADHISHYIEKMRG